MPGSSSLLAINSISSFEKIMSIFVARINLPFALRIPTFFPIIWNRGSFSEFRNLLCTSGGTVIIRYEKKSDGPGQDNASLRGSQFTGGFHSTRINSTGILNRFTCSDRQSMKCCILGSSPAPWSSFLETATTLRYGFSGGICCFKVMLMGGLRLC